MESTVMLLRNRSDWRKIKWFARLSLDHERRELYHKILLATTKQDVQRLLNELVKIPMNPYYYLAIGEVSPEMYFAYLDNPQVPVNWSDICIFMSRNLKPIDQVYYPLELTKDVEDEIEADKNFLKDFWTTDVHVGLLLSIIPNVLKVPDIRGHLFAGSHFVGQLLAKARVDVFSLVRPSDFIPTHMIPK